MGGDWRLVARPSAGDGRYSFTWRPQHHGKRRVRVTFRADRINARAARPRTVRIYEHDPPTWCGPGFYGRRTACGRRLTRRTLGVANRHLPCGTPVSFMYRGHTVTVPVMIRSRVSLPTGSTSSAPGGAKAGDAVTGPQSVTHRKSAAPPPFTLP